MSCISVQDPQLVRLADAIAQRVGAQRFSVWFNNSTRLELKQEGLEIAVPNDFISEWINTHFTRPIQEACNEVMGGPMRVRYQVMPQLFEKDAKGAAAGATAAANGHHYGHGESVTAVARAIPMRPALAGTMGRSAKPANGNGNAVLDRRAEVAPARPAVPATTTAAQGASAASAASAMRPRLRHELDTFVIGPANQLAFNTASYVAEFPGAQYNPLFIHGNCGLGKTHLLQGVCKKFAQHHPTKRWAYMTGEDFTNEFLSALRANKVDSFRRKMRDLDLLVIDDVHFMGGKKATQEEFLHTFNAIEAMGKQVVMASDNHPKMIEEFGESLVNRFVSGMVVRIDPPNFQTRCQILRTISDRSGVPLGDEVIGWVARRVTQNVRELEGAVTRIAAHVKLTGQAADVAMAQEALGDLDRQMVAPVKPETVLNAVCVYFGIELKDLMSGRRQRTVSLARSVAMYLVRKMAKLSFPEIGSRMGRRNHSTVISACRRIEKAVAANEPVSWTSAVGERSEEAAELIQRIEEHSRAMN